jgi:hypothetical protein
MLIQCKVFESELFESEVFKSKFFENRPFKRISERAQSVQTRLRAG